jgi:alkanesulfonate monooxygenase SsuD/methylene tetrahydromethanopterin reductase-like flavin-dependent oxidoreductase (luciferase family)
VLDLHGWGAIGEQLSRHAARGEWEAMPGLVTDEMLEACAIWGAPDEVAARLRTEYSDLVDRLGVYERLGSYEFVVSSGREAVWRALIDGLRTR